MGIEESAGVEDLDVSIGVLNHIVIDISRLGWGNQSYPDLLWVVWVVFFALDGKDRIRRDWGIGRALLVGWGNLRTLFLKTLVHIFVGLTCGIRVTRRFEGFSLLLFLLLRFLVDFLWLVPWLGLLFCFDFVFFEVRSFLSQMKCPLLKRLWIHFLIGQS